MRSHAEYLALKRFPALDGLRAVSALLVVLFHNEGPDILQGWLGVQVFFVLSGFLITTLLLRERDRTGRVSLRAFYIRRAFRILPVYFLILGLTLAGLLVAGQFLSQPPGTELPQYLLFFTEFGHGGAYGQAWSLGIEQKFYLLWPVLAFCAIGVGRNAAFGLRLGLTLLLMALSLAAVPFTVSSDPRGWPVHYFSILMGCLLAVVMHNPRGYALLRPLARPWVAVAFVAAHLCVSFIVDFLDHHKVLGVPGFVAVVPLYALAVAVLLPALIAPGVPQWLLSRRPMVFLGERSYSIYLVQSIASGVVIVLLPWATGMAKAVPAVLVAVLVAHFCYRWVELPMIKRGQRIVRRAGRAFPEEAPAVS
ncbi:acyltransferase [Kutzneria viridogrisea]|uniref:Peptidoglycan/LPS O-acetylase OafA/YrhL n=1 Tax=Kutzneria viridogrisea TaxID=47990 RepID=A0ABR6B9T6_9PSEU|nr:peptidoglycan/LPS O-acetylase OafA/YrhL [Kutzneria viridogrisea]